jgi:hypothetical protein
MLKRLPTEWEKIFAGNISDKELITRMFRDLKKLHYQKINDPMKKWANELNRAFSKEEVQMAINHMKKCSTSLAIKEIQIKNHIKDSTSILFRIATTKNTTTNVGKDVEKKKPPYTAGGNEN